MSENDEQLRRWDFESCYNRWITHERDSFTNWETSMSQNYENIFSDYENNPFCSVALTSRALYMHRKREWSKYANQTNVSGKRPQLMIESTCVTRLTTTQCRSCVEIITIATQKQAAVLVATKMEHNNCNRGKQNDSTHALNERCGFICFCIESCFVIVGIVSPQWRSTTPCRPGD